MHTGDHKKGNTVQRLNMAGDADQSQDKDQTMHQERMHDQQLKISPRSLVCSSASSWCAVCRQEPSTGDPPNLTSSIRAGICSTMGQQAHHRATEEEARDPTKTGDREDDQCGGEFGAQRSGEFIVLADVGAIQLYKVGNTDAVQSRGDGDMVHHRSGYQCQVISRSLGDVGAHAFGS